MTTTVVVKALIVAVTATPASASRTVETPVPSQATLYTISAPTRQPKKEASGTALGGKSLRRSVVIAATSPPPADTPRMYGSPSGERTTPCSSVPDSARFRPTSPATSTRGSRTSLTIISVALATLVRSRSARITWSAGIDCDPLPSAKIIAPSSSTPLSAMIPNRAARRRRAWFHVREEGAWANASAPTVYIPSP